MKFDIGKNDIEADTHYEQQGVPMKNSLKEHPSEISRRDFLKTVSVGVAAIGGMALLANLEACTSANNGISAEPLTGQKEKLILANEPALQNVGGFVQRTFGNNTNGNNPVIVVRTAANGSGAFQTMSVICTHAGCSVGNPSGGQVYCPCHGSVFGAQASNFAAVLGGPAPSALQTFATTFDGTTITISM